jgi:hypothetical protein
VERSDTRCGGSIDDVGLAAASLRKLSDSCSCGRGHVEHDLAPSNEPLRQMSTKAAGVLDSPQALWELLGPSHQFAIARQRRIDPQ